VALHISRAWLLNSYNRYLSSIPTELPPLYPTSETFRGKVNCALQLVCPNHQLKLHQFRDRAVIQNDMNAVMELIGLHKALRNHFRNLCRYYYWVYFPVS